MDAEEPVLGEVASGDHVVTTASRYCYGLKSVRYPANITEVNCNPHLCNNILDS